MAEGSSRSVRQEIEEVDCVRVFEALTQLGVYIWEYLPEIAEKNDDPFPHMSPYPEDIKAVFAIGNSRTLHFLDIVGISIAASKGALEKINQLEERIAKLEAAMGPVVVDPFKEIENAAG